MTRGYDNALDPLHDAMLAAEHLDEVADHPIGHLVDQARRSGAPWTDIGRCVGVTRQAAQKRLVPKEGPDLDPSHGSAAARRARGAQASPWPPSARRRWRRTWPDSSPP
ncbi:MULTISPECIES: hypothetical protein [unclassified Streptomyces]|uniref:hypothetical protein n=1 Tax=unclassified Streptomyces TaxID=2593676 RepID=UPI003B635D92